MPSDFLSANPPRVAVIEYVPGGSAGNRNEPSASVTAVLTPTNDGLLASTVTPGKTAPDESLTVPCIEPVCSCAHRGTALNKAAASNAASFLITPPPGRPTSPPPGGWTPLLRGEYYTFQGPTSAVM